MMIHKPITIVGSGPVGMVAAIKLAITGHMDITLMDTNIATNAPIVENTQLEDGRVLALSYASYKILDDIGAWDMAFATAIKQVHISHSGLGISRINSTDIPIADLGYTVKYSDLCNKLRQCIANYPQIKPINATVKKVIPNSQYVTIMYDDEQILTTNWLILAEGGKIKPEHIKYKEYDYKQTAIVTTVDTQIKHNNVAYERFDNSGALVLLPHNKQYVMVYSVAQEHKNDMLEPDMLETHLNNLKFMQRFGKIKLSSPIYSFPLKLQIAKNCEFKRIILVGNSAQTVHPVSAQGLNLGLRDVDTLIELIKDDTTNIANYYKLRMNDSRFVIGFTHFLAKFLELPHTSHLRGLGLITFSNCKFLQNKLANSLIFGN